MADDPSAKASCSDEAALGLAVELSERGYPAPNPRVGCVIFKGRQIVGKGYHDHAGGPHAEVMALQEAGPRAEGATACVTLEPCNNHGRTPPCTEALIKSKVAKVIYGVSDPNPAMAGGAERLRQAGIECYQIDCARLESKLNQPWLIAMRRGYPFVALKAAVSLDGRVALQNGRSKWITGPEARARGHELRAEYGAVLVGRKTVEIDDPSLTARIPGVVNQPLRVVVDLDRRLGMEHKVFTDDAAETVILSRRALGVEPGGAVSVKAMLSWLFEMGIRAVLVEGGPTTITHFVRERMFDRLHLFAAPILLGSGPSFLGDIGLEDIDSAPRVQQVDSRFHGEDAETVLEPL